MKRIAIILLVLAIRPSAIWGQTQTDWESEVKACIEFSSGFPKDQPTPNPPPYPADFRGVYLKYYEPGCGTYDTCPEFRLTISKESARFEGIRYVRAKGIRPAKLTQQEFEKFLRAWFDGKFYAMREDYCNYECPDGRSAVVLDARESSVGIRMPTYEKHVGECFATSDDDKPIRPKPPDQYFELRRMFRDFVMAHGWL